MTRRPRPRLTRATWGLFAGTALIAMAGCGSSNVVAGDSTSDDSTPTSSPAPRTADLSISDDGQAKVDAENDGGDKVALGVNFGQPTPFSEVSSKPAEACRDQVDPSRTVVIPVQLSVDLESSVEATVTVEPVAESLNTSSSRFHLDWAVTFTDSGPTCHADSDNAAFGVTWSQMQPGATRTSVAYLVIDGAMSPDDPTGDDLAKLSIVQPRVLINHDLVSNDFTHQISATGSRALDCGNGLVDGAPASIVVDRDAALANGCQDQSP